LELSGGEERRQQTSFREQREESESEQAEKVDFLSLLVQQQNGL